MVSIHSAINPGRTPQNAVIRAPVCGAFALSV
jgi:hypothetical protein